PLDPKPPVDFRARDLVEAQSLNAPEPRASSATRIPVARPPERFDIPAIAIPEMPMPAPPPKISRAEPEDLSDTKPTAAPASAPPARADRFSDTNPIGQAKPEPGEKLTERMGQPFARLSHGVAPPEAHADAIERIDYQPERGDDTKPNRRGGRRREDRAARANGDETRPRGALAHRRERDAVADMWQPAPEDEPAVSRDWA